MRMSHVFVSGATNRLILKLNHNYNGHGTCGDNYERELNRKYDQELIDACPPGTRFDLAGGAACD